MKALEDLKEILEDQVKKITKKGDINPAELENVYKAVDIIKDIQTIDAMKKADEYSGEGERSPKGYSQEHYSRDGYSQRYMPPVMYSYDPVWNNPHHEDMGGMAMPHRQDRMYANDGMSNDGRRGRDGDGDGRYSETGNSYRRGRDSRGRYTSRDGRYSQEAGKERMIEKLEEMADEATSSKERNAIMQCIEKLDT